MASTLGYTVRGLSLTKVSYKTVFSRKSGINEVTDLAVSQLRGSTIAIISAHVPGQHMWASAGRDPSSSQREIATDEIQEEEEIIESVAI